MTDNKTREFFKLQINNFQDNEELNFKVLKKFIEHGIVGINNWKGGEKQIDIFKKLEENDILFIHLGKRAVGICRVKKEGVIKSVSDNDLETYFGNLKNIILEEQEKEQKKEGCYTKEGEGKLRSLVNVEWIVKPVANNKSDLPHIMPEIKINILNTFGKILDKETHEAIRKAISNPIGYNEQVSLNERKETKKKYVQSFVIAFVITLVLFVLALPLLDNDLIKTMITELQWKMWMVLSGVFITIFTLIMYASYSVFIEEIQEHKVFNFLCNLRK